MAWYICAVSDVLAVSSKEVQKFRPSGIDGTDGYKSRKKH